MTVGATPNVSAYDEEFIFAGQPDVDSFATFFDMGVKTVINLRSEEEISELDFDEEETVTKLGMRYVNIPVLKKGFEAEMIEAVMGELAESDGKTLLHCASSSRVGYAWSTYRGVRDGLSADKAIAEGKLAGLHSEGLETRARKFIEDGVKQGMEQVFPGL